MPFFEDVDGLGIIERHIRRVTGLELEQSRNLLRVYTKARRELISRLQLADRGTFTEARMQTVLNQLDTAIFAIQRQLDSEMELGADILEEQAVEDAAKEINRFEKHFRGVSLDIPVQAILESLDQKTLLLNRYRSSMASYNASLRSNIQRELTQAVVQRTNYFEAIQRVSTVIPGFGHPLAWQVQRITRTELHNIYNVSKLGGFRKVKQDFIPGLKKTLIHPMDGRTAKDSKKLAQENPIIPIDQPFRFKWQGTTRIFMAPPDRPNDRSILVPYSAAWDK